MLNAHATLPKAQSSRDDVQLMSRAHHAWLPADLRGADHKEGASVVSCREEKTGGWYE